MLLLLLCPYKNFISFMPAILLCLVDGNLSSRRNSFLDDFTTSVFLHRPGFRRVGGEWIVSFKDPDFIFEETSSVSFEVSSSVFLEFYLLCRSLLITLIFGPYFWGFTLIMGKWRIENKIEYMAIFWLWLWESALIACTIAVVFICISPLS